MVAAKGTYALVKNEFPELKHGKEVVSRNLATGLNPIDFKSVDYNFCLLEFPWVTGWEMAGIIEVVGEEVADFRVGDRVWTKAHTTATAAQAASNNSSQNQHTPSFKTRSLAEDLGATVIIRDGKTEDEIVSSNVTIGGDDITRAIDLVGPHTANYCLKAFSKNKRKKCLFALLAMISSKTQVPGNINVER